MPIRELSRGARRAYTKGVKKVGNTVNAFIMKPVTRKMTGIAKKTRVGRYAAPAFSVPRKLTKAAVATGLAIPRAVGRVATTGRDVLSHVMLDPLLAMGAGSPLVILGLSPSGEPKSRKPVKKLRAKK